MKQYIYIAFSVPKEICHEIVIDDAIDDKSSELLNTELEEHIQKYKNIIKNRYCYKYENMPTIIYMYSNFKINEKIEKELLQYFWALEDGEIIIQKKSYTVKSGDIIIFPNSWVFPYELNFKYIN